MVKPERVFSFGDGDRGGLTTPRQCAIVLAMTLQDTYRRPYRLRMAQPGAKTLEVTFPYEVVEREARRNELSVDEFVKQFQVVAHFNGVDGVVYTFERIDSPEREKK